MKIITVQRKRFVDVDKNVHLLHESRYMHRAREAHSSIWQRRHVRRRFFHEWQHPGFYGSLRVRGGPFGDQDHIDLTIGAHCSGLAERARCLTAPEQSVVAVQSAKSCKQIKIER